MHSPNTTQKRTTRWRAWRKRRTGRSQHRWDQKTHQKKLKQLWTKLLGSHYWASLLVRGEGDWPSIINRFDFFHTTPTPTGCLLPRYWALQGMDEWAVRKPDRSWTDPGSFHLDLTESETDAWRLYWARVILWDFTWVFPHGFSVLLLKHSTSYWRDLLGLGSILGTLTKGQSGSDVGAPTYYYYIYVVQQFFLRILLEPVKD